jgi:hypothetical protein
VGVVGPRLASARACGPTPEPTELTGAADHTPESITRAKATASRRALEGLRDVAEANARARVEAGTEGPALRTAREVVADEQVLRDVRATIENGGRPPEGISPESQYGKDLISLARRESEGARTVEVRRDGSVVRTDRVASRSSRIGEPGRPVSETQNLSNEQINLIVRGPTTYEAIVTRAQAIAERLGIPPEQVDVAVARAIRDFFQTGRTPEGLAGTNRQQRSDLNFFGQLERLVLTSETLRSPTNLADVAQVVRAVAEGRLPLTSLSRDYPAGLAAREADPSSGILSAEGGSPGSRRALERALGAPRRENATDRAADEVLARQGRLAQDPAVRGARDEAGLADVFLRDIIATLFGGRR